MLVKENHPHLHTLLGSLFERPLGRGVDLRQAQTHEKGHGRIERRRLTASQSLARYVNWPGVAQVFRLERARRQVRSGKQEEEVVYGMTSLPRGVAGPRRLLQVVRGQWRIENQSHWVRDVTYDEDRSPVRKGSIPQVMAAIRNTAIGLLRWAGRKNIAAAGRYYAAHPWEAVGLLGVRRDN